MSTELVPPIPARAEQAPTRLYYLDALRVIAILFVFLYHAVHPFDKFGWHVKNIDQSMTLTIILVILGMWGMPFFFLIAGSGSWLALRRRTAKAYVAERTRRLFVPYLFFTIISFFITEYYEWGDRVYRGITTDSFLQYLQATWHWFLSWGISPIWLAAGGHLWFLGFLYAFSVLALPLFLWFKGERGRRFIDWLAGVCSRRGGLLVLLIPLVLIRYLVNSIFPQEHNWGDFIYQGLFFILGFLLFSNEAILKSVRRDGWLLGAIGLVALLIMMGLFLLGYDVMAWGEEYGQARYYLVIGLVTVVGLTWSLCMLSIGMRYMNIDKSWLRYAQEIALPFFIVHQPVILLIASYVVKWDAGIPLKMLVVVTSSFFVCWALVEFIIRRVGFLRFLFGMTSAREKGKGEAQAKPAGVGIS
jgi:peptidoglycan/LPS O-acetylase OafA/YrhL